MNKQTKELLRTAKEYCDKEDKSTGFMLQYMQDFANVDLEVVLDFLEEESHEQ